MSSRLTTSRIFRFLEADFVLKGSRRLAGGMGGGLGFSGRKNALGALVVAGLSVGSSDLY